jgi:hypothetical protein
MSAVPRGAASRVGRGETDFSRTYVLVVVVEIAAIAGLYWLGRYFS